ncbi:hypothetical protein Hanom_Chr12g01113901 [Helianthus anomalus]
MDPKSYLQFDIIHDFPPPSRQRLLSPEVWHEMCKYWNTLGRLKKPKSGSKNRRSVDSSGKSSGHMGGSMGYAECRTRMWDYLSAMCDVYGPNFSGYPDER